MKEKCVARPFGSGQSWLCRHEADGGQESLACQSWLCRRKAAGGPHPLPVECRFRI